MQQFLECSQYIDWEHPLIISKALELSAECSSDKDIAQNCFEFVRDEIKHSWDYKLNPITCKASDVLLFNTGYCYAKSHLLAALLRANGIPTALCYQRLTITTQPPYCLHGLNAIYLKEYGWYRVDARGNKTGVNAKFCPPIEKLAFPIVRLEEEDLAELYSQPHPSVVDVLTRYETIEQVFENLPDL